MNKEIRSLFQSFYNACRGFLYCVNNERNIRIHITAAAYVLLFSFFYDFSFAQYGVLLLVIALVIAMEMMNTSIEALVNLISPSYSGLARIAKDVAAGAVIVCAGAAAVVGVLYFWNIPVFAAILSFLWSHPFCLFLLLLSAAGACWFIFRGPGRVAKQLTEKKKR
ncbi:MAG: diacylglycerol kinase family protein [Oscillospiraceae bacterium]|nr:diacylglycerol kinase family protein [Oscillospiraceae bacterium]